jgi:hypothetical protein
VGGQFLQGIEITLVIIVGVEAGITVVAALYDVPGNAGNSKPGASRHD